MSADKMELREILESNIGDVYKHAQGILKDPMAAKDVTRRVMALLKRTYEAGLSVTPDMVKRVTEDCCNEQTSYNSKKAAFRDGVIADMPDFDTAIASITGEEVRAKARSDAEDKAAEAHEAMRQAEALAAKPVMPARSKDALPREQEAPRKRYTCVADIFEETDGEPAAETPAEEVAERPAEKPAKEPRKRPWKKDDDDYDDDDDDYDDYDDDDDDDEDDIEDEKYESLFDKKEKAPLLPLIGVWVLIVLLACVAFCLVIMLMQRGVLPGGSGGFAKNFAGWFNSHLFTLF